MGSESTFFKPGQVPQNKIFNEEKEKFLIDNFRTMSKTDLAKHIGVKSAQTILKKMNELGLKRTPEEIKKIIEKAKQNINYKKCAIKALKIEGGGRNGKASARWHKTKWIQTNGEIPKGMTLVYENADYENFNDLILIRNRSYSSYIKKRDIALRKEVKAKSKAATNFQAEERRKRYEKTVQLQEELKKNYKQKTLTEVLTEQIESEKVPVRLDHKTLIFVKKEKCYQDEGGNWHKKQS